MVVFHWRLISPDSSFLFPQTGQATSIFLVTQVNMGFFSFLFYMSTSSKSPTLAISTPNWLLTPVSSHCKQSYTNASQTITCNHLRTLLKCRLWFSRSALGPESLHFQHAPTWCNAAGWGTTPLNSWDHFVFLYSLSTCTVYSMVFSSV